MDINQLQNIIKAVRKSPQCCQAWLEEVNIYLRNMAAALGVALQRMALMLSLDVKTCWSSTHQMLHEYWLPYYCLLILTGHCAGRAIDYRKVINDFVSKNKDLHKYELQDEDWEAIILVAKWLKSFQSATTQMLTTQRPMLSWTHAIFRGLQDSLAESLRTLPDNTPSWLKLGLMRVH